MTSFRFAHLRGDDLGSVADELASLEAEIRYPIADGRDHFRIDHGARYAQFFEDIGDAHFWIAFADGRLAGVLVGAFKELEVHGRRVPTLYAADYKIAPAWRGGRLARRFLWRGLLKTVDPAVPRWRLAFGAAMRGARGDVMRTATRLSPIRMTHPAARLAVYFVPQPTLAALSPDGAPPPPVGGVDLSPRPRVEQHGTVTTAGRKDLRLDSRGGEPWPLVHLPLGPAHWRPHLGAYLRAAAGAMPEGSIACFAIDERLSDHVAWLARAGVTAGATCTVYALRWPGVPSLTPWVHLATSEI